MKTCGTCKLEKSLDEFYDDPRWVGSKRSYCIVCHKKKRAEYRKAKKEEIKAANRAYYFKNREKILAVNKAYDQANKDTRGSIRVRQRERRLRDVKTTPYTRQEIFDRDQWVCQLCNKPIDPSLIYTDLMAATIDHIWPLSQGGADGPENVQAAHRSCNSSKQSSLHFTIFRLPELVR